METQSDTIQRILREAGPKGGHWSYYCYAHDRVPYTDPRTGALTCGMFRGIEEHGQPYGYRFVPSTGTMVAGRQADGTLGIEERAKWEDSIASAVAQREAYPDRL